MKITFRISYGTLPLTLADLLNKLKSCSGQIIGPNPDNSDGYIFC